jgi:hypothetical protein
MSAIKRRLHRLVRRIKSFGQIFLRSWAWLQRNASGLQTVAAVLGISLIGFAAIAAFFEYRAYQFEYGRQLIVSFTHGRLLVAPANKFISGIKQQTHSFITFSDKRYESSNVQYIELINYLDQCDPFYNRYCSQTALEVAPKQTAISVLAQLNSLEMLFNTTPTKLYADILCVTDIEFVDAKGVYQVEHYLRAGASKLRVCEHRYQVIGIERAGESLVLQATFVGLVLTQ